MTRKEKLEQLLWDANNQNKHFWQGYDNEENPMSQIEEVLERQIEIIKVLLAEAEDATAIKIGGTD